MNLIHRALLKYLLLSAAKQHRNSGRAPLAGYAFDLITSKIHIDGRFADAEIAALETHLFPILPKGGICLDVGANIGNHAVSFADFFAQVHAFEPNARALDLLRLNARLKPNVTVHAFGLSDHAQHIEVVQPAGNLGGTGAAASGTSALDQNVTLELRPLDDAPLDLNGGKVTFVKIDVEGHEPQAIKGMSALLSTHSPVIGIEVSRHTVRNGTSAALEAARAAGYLHIYEMKKGGKAGFARLNQLTPRNHPLLILSKTALDLG